MCADVIGHIFVPVVQFGSKSLKYVVNFMKSNKRSIIPCVENYHSNWEEL